MNSNKQQKTVLILLAVIGFLAGLWMALSPKEPVVSLTNINAKNILPNHRDIQKFTLKNSAGGNFSKQDFIGKWSVVSIGYTHCPDICPDTLVKYQIIKKSLENYPKLSQKTQFIFVSVDPFRDVPENLSRYVHYFDPNFIGLSGDNEALKKFSDVILASFIQPDITTKNYEVGHSTYLHLINPKGQLSAVISPPFEAFDIVQHLRYLLTKF